jgi:MYXO-CTERM domain-containing protein
VKWILGFVCLMLGLVVTTWSGSVAAQERCPYAVNGTVGAGDPAQSGRLQTGTPSTCVAPRPVPAVVQANGSFRYDSYTLRNRTGGSACVSISTTATQGSAHTSAYLGAYVETNPQTNYLGDSGANAQNSTTTFSVTVPSLSNVVVVVHETTGAGATYSLAVSDCGSVAVTNITPNSGPTAGGASVTLKGTGFLANATVMIGGAATDVIVVDEATITAKTPINQPAGAVNVVVTNTDASTATLTGGYSYVAPAATTVVLASSANPAVFGQSITLTATATAAGGTPTGSIAFKEGATTLGTVAMVGGVATLTKADFTTGAHTITAEYAGGGGFGAGTSSALTQSVNVASTTSTIVSSRNPSPLSEVVTFTMNVTPAVPGGGTPQGTVNFTDNGLLIGTSTLDIVGKTSFATSGLGVGTHSIVATYEGTANYATSASLPLAQEITTGTPDSGASSSSGGVDSGTSSSSSSSSSSSGSSSGGTDAGVNPLADGETEGGGCDCRAAGGGSSGLAALAGALAVLAIVTRRKRR